MANTNNLTNFLQDVADAIKVKKEYSNSVKIPAANFDLEIANINTLKGEQIIVSPLTSQQVITPSANKNAITQVTINAVTSDIDSNILANNIKMGVNILGVEGNLEPDKPDQTKTVDPTTNVQNITPDTGYELAQVTINAVTSAIDANITVENIKSGVNILGVTGNYVGTVINNQDKSVNPSTTQVVVGADTGYTGLGQVTVNAVTSNIDNNITAENIKSGVNILGITGNYSGTVINNQDKTITQNGVYNADAGYTGLGTVNVSVDSIPEGIFIQENSPTKTTDEAFWLKETAIEGVKINLNDLPDDVLNMSITTTNGVKTIRDVVNNMTSQQKATYNSYTYHGIYINYTTNNIYVFASQNKCDMTKSGNSVILAFNSGGKINSWCYSSGDMTVSTGATNACIFTITDNYVLILDTSYSSGGMTLPDNASDYLTVDTGLYITVSNKRYIAYKSGVDLPFGKILDTTNATAISNKILNGYTAFVNNEKLTGTMNNLGILNYNPSISVQNIPEGYTTGGTINAVDSSIDVNITAENIKSGVTILNITGNYEGGQAETWYKVPDGMKFTGDITSISNLDLGDVITKSVDMFANCTNLTDISNIININNGSQLFHNCKNLINVSNIDLSNSNNMYVLFGSCPNLRNISDIKFSTTATDLLGIFQVCYNLTSVPYFDTSNVTVFAYSFTSDYNLINVPQYNTVNVVSLEGAFQRCNNLSDASIQNIINMCLNSNITNTSLKNLSTSNLYSMFKGSNITSTRYQNRLTELTAAGWSY